MVNCLVELLDGNDFELDIAVSTVHLLLSRKPLNRGTLKMREMENAGKEMRHKITGVENVGNENAALDTGSGK